MNKPVFMTGSTGVIGHGLARRLLSNEQKVIAAVRRHPAPTTDLETRRAFALTQLVNSSRGQFVPAYQSLSPTAKELKEQQKFMRDCDVVFHLGGWSSHKISDQEMPIAFGTNVLWTLALAKMAVKANVKQFVFASSRSVFDFCQFDTSTPIVVNEKHQIVLPVDLNDWKQAALLAFDNYLEDFLRGKNKRSPEEYCQAYMQQHPIPGLQKGLRYPLTKLMGETIVSGLDQQGVRGTSLRLKPVYGPSPVEQDSRLIPKSIKELLGKHTLTAWPEASGFLYLEDLVYALEAFCRREYDDRFDSRNPNPVLLLGHDRQSLSQQDLFNAIGRAIGHPQTSIFLDDQKPGKQAEVFDVSAAEHNLGFRNSPFSFAIERTVQYFMDRYFLTQTIMLADKGDPESVCKVGAMLVKNGEVLGADHKSFRGRIHSDIMAIAYAIQYLSGSDPRIADTAKPLLDLLRDTHQEDLDEKSIDFARRVRHLIWETCAAIREKHDIDIFSGATLYINLEPCNSLGFWTGCAEVIAKVNIKRVVIAARDPGISMAGKGIEQLRDWGVEVVEMQELSPLAQNIDPDWFNGKKLAAHRELRKDGK